MGPFDLQRHLQDSIMSMLLLQSLLGDTFIFTSNTQQLRTLRAWPETAAASAASREGKCVEQLSQARPNPWIVLWKHKAGKAFTWQGLLKIAQCFLNQNRRDKRGEMYSVCVRKEAVHRAWDFQSL